MPACQLTSPQEAAGSQGNCAGQEETVAMFRAQRNLYLVGATLGLALVIRRVALLAVTLARVEEERDTVGQHIHHFNL